MKKLNFQLFLLVLLSCFALKAFAWDHSIEIGYGRSPDKNHRQYYNSGVWINDGDLLDLLRIMRKVQARAEPDFQNLAARLA